MLRFSTLLTATAVFALGCTTFNNGSFAAGANKTDTLLQQAIQETAQPEPMPEPIMEPEPMPVIEEPLPVIVDNNIETIEPPPPSDELGLRWGGLLIKPQLLVSETYDDNIYATDTNTESDFVTALRPSVEITLPDSRHELTIKGDYEFRKYLDNDNEDQHNLGASIEGFLKGADWLKIPFAAFWKNKHEERADDLTVQLSDDPIRMDTLEARTGIEIKPGRLALGILGHYGKERYEDGFSTVNSAQVIRRDGDRDWMKAEAYTAYDLSNNHRIKLSGTIGERNYENRNFQGGGFNGPLRDSQTWGATAGWHFAFAGLKGHLTGGMEEYNYDSAAINDIDEIVLSGLVSHNFNDKTSFNLTFGRDIYEHPEIVNPAIRNQVGVYLDHKLGESFLVAAGADYEYLEFDSLARDDETWKLRALADYFLTDNFALGLEYIYSQRDSSVLGADYDRNQIMLKARGRI